MAARTADLKVITKVDIATLRASFKEAAKIAKAELAEVANLLGKSLIPDASKAKAELRKTMKELAAEARKAAGGDSIIPPTRPPKPPAEPRTPKGGGGGDPEPQTGPSFASLVAEEEKKIAAIRAQYRGRTKKEDDELAKELIENLAEVQEKKILAINAGKRATTDAARDEAKAMKASLDEQARLLGRVAKEKSAVINDGAGAKAGILGLGRNLLNPATLMGPLTGMLGGLGLGAIFGEVISGGKEFQAGVAELSAITGVAGESLDVMAGKARALALEFGGSASGNITAFKGILSKLGPDIAKSPAALESMTRAVNTLSAATGDDAAASMDALTTGLLQFQVSLDDPVAAAAEMTKQMNVMAAGAKEGAAEVPQIADAIKVAGVAASNSKVSFEETNAALQALAAGGKVGAEAGTALRNVLGKLGEGRFLPKEVQDELGKAGVDISKLGDTSLTLTDRMRELNKISGDSALVTKLFGTENAAAANILLRSTDAIDTLKVKMTGTNTAFDQAATRQATFAAQWDRFTALLSDTAIGVFETIGPALSAGLSGLVTVISSLGAAFGAVFSFIGENSTAVTALAVAIGAVVIGANAAAIATTIWSTVSKASVIWTKAVAAAQWLWNIALNANPIGAVIIAATALGAVLVSLSGKMKETIEDQQNANEAEKAYIQSQIKGNEAQQNKARSIQQAASEYERLATKSKRSADEERRIFDLHKQISGAYPKLIDGTKSYSGSLDGVKKAAQQAKDDLVKLGKEMQELNARMVANTLQASRIAVANASKGFGSILGDIDWKEDFDIASQSKAINALINGAMDRAGTTGFGPAIDKIRKEFNELFAAIDNDPGGKLKAQTKLSEITTALFNLNSAIIESKNVAEENPIVVDPPGDTDTDTDTDEQDSERKAGELDVSSEINSIRAAARDKDSEAALTAIRDQTERERTELKLKYDKERDTALAAQQTLLRKLQENAAKPADERAIVVPVKILNADGSVERTLTDSADIIAYTQQQIAVTTLAIEKNRLEAQIELERKFEADKARIRSEGMARYIALIQRDEGRIVGNTEDDEVARLQKKLTVLDTQRAAEIGTALSTNEELLRIAAQRSIAEQRLADERDRINAERAKASLPALTAREELSDPTLSPLHGALENTKRDFFALRAELIKTNPEILAIIAKFADERGAIETEGDNKILDARSRERIAKLETMAEQEREIALVELEKWIKEEQDLNKGNTAKLEEIEREGAKRRQAIEVEYLRKTNALYDVMFDIRAAIVEAFGAKVDAARREQLEKQRDDLKKEEEQLRESLDKRVIDYTEWTQKQADIAKKAAEVQKELEGNTGDFLEDLRVKTAAAMAKSHEKLNTRFAEKNAELIKSGTDGEKISARQRIQQAVLAAAVITTSIADIAAQGKLFTEEGGKAVLQMAWDTLQGLAATYIAGILGSSLGFLGPVAGPIAAGVLTAVFEAAMSAAKGSILGAATGEDRITGPGSRTSDSILRKVSVDEAIIRHETANAGAGDYSNRAAIKWGNKNPGRSWREFFAPSFTVADVVAMGRQALALPALNLSAIEVTTAGIAPEAFNALVAEQAATNARLEELAHENRKMTRWLRRTAKSNEEMATRDRGRSAGSGRRNGRPNGTF